MKRVFKVAAWFFGGLLLLLLIVAVTVPLFINPNDYKQQIADAVESYTGRQLTIKGDLSLSVFPWLGVETGPFRLSNPPGSTGEAMLSVASARVRLRLIPLLRNQIQLDTVELHEPVLHLLIGRDGRGNWEGLIPRAAVGSKSDNKLASVAGAIAINGLIVNRGTIVWHDQYNPSRYEVRELYVETGKVLNMTPVEMKIRCKLIGTTLPQTKLAIRSVLLLDVEKTALQFTDTQFTVSVLGLNSATQVKNVRIDQLGQSVLFSGLSSKIAYGSGDYAVSIDQLSVRQMGVIAKTGEIRMTGRYRKIDLAAQLTDVVANFDRQTFTVPTFALRADDAKITGLLSVQSIMANPRLVGRVQTNQFHLRRLLKKLQLDWDTVNQEALSKLQLVSEFEWTTDELRLKHLQASIDGMSATGFFAMIGSARPRFLFDLKLGDLNVDNYLPPTKPEDDPVSAPGAFVLALPAMLFQDLDAEGVVTLSTLNVSGFAVENVLVGVHSMGRVVDIQPITAQLYGGQLEGSMQLDVSQAGAQVTVKQSLTNVNIGPILSAAKITNRVDGIGNLSLTATAQRQGATETLRGETRFDLRQGAIKGFNIRELVMQARDIYVRAKGREPVMDAGSPDQAQFQFTELSGSLQFDQNTAKNQDLKIKSPYLRVLGSGLADLKQRNLDYGIEVYVVESARGQGGEELAELQGIPIPISVKGPFAQPLYRLNIDRLLQLALQKRLEKEQIRFQKKFEQKLQNKLEKLLQ